jgi:hypothetical protein
MIGQEFAYRLVGRLQQVTRDTTQLDDGTTIHAVSIQLQQLPAALSSMPVHAFATFDAHQTAAAVAMEADLRRLQSRLVEVHGVGLTVTSGLVPVMFGLCSWGALGADAEMAMATAVASRAIDQAATTSRAAGH